MHIILKDKPIRYIPAILCSKKSQNLYKTRSILSQGHTSH
jgi:hypothetical protein